MRDDGPTLKFWDAICSYIADHIKVVLHVYNTFYCAVTYHILQLHAR